MIGEERNYIAALAEDIFGESLQSLLRSNFDKDPSSRFVERAQAFDELHGRGNLLREQVQHLRHNVGTCGIKLAIDIRDNGQARRFQMQAFQFLPQRFARWRHD